jgi:hypothetical protein
MFLVIWYICGTDIEILSQTLPSSCSMVFSEDRVRYAGMEYRWCVDGHCVKLEDQLHIEKRATMLLLVGGSLALSTRVMRIRPTITSISRTKFVMTAAARRKYCAIFDMLVHQFTCCLLPSFSFPTSCSKRLSVGFDP